MQGTSNEKTDGKSIELATFFVGSAFCGLDILNIQEINKLMEMTHVPQTPDYVKGILNLRGQIVTIIDLRKKLGLAATGSKQQSRNNIIVKSKDEYIGFLTDGISDVLRINLNEVEPPPANIGGIQGIFFKGVYKTEDKLIGLLDIDKVLKVDE